MQCYSEILPPTGVTHSLRVNFTAPDSNNLIVAKTSVIQIYQLRVAEESEQAQLVLIAEYALQGIISALAKVDLIKAKSGGEALLIAFRDAKLSLIEWDPSQHSISTISIHYYENHELLLCPWSPDLKDCPTHLTVDPSSRCAAFNFNAGSLAIIPFNQPGDDLAMDDDLDDFDDEEKRNSSPTKQIQENSGHGDKLYSPSFVLPLTALDPNLLHPISMIFLHEYREPTIGVLFSTPAASMNMTPIRKDIVTYAVYTLDIEQKASTTLLSVAKLPNDLQQVFGMPAPIGGTLLVGGNELIHIDQGGRSNAVGVNEFSKIFSSYPMADLSGLEMRLEGCKIEHLGTSSNEVLIVLNNGTFAILSFRMDGRSVSGLNLRKVDPATTTRIFRSRCSTITTLPRGHLFLGSEEADSILLSTLKAALQLKKVSSRAYLDDTNGEVDMEEDDDDDDDDDDLYAERETNGNSQQVAFDEDNITLKDTLLSFAPLQDMTFGRPPKRKRVDEDEEDEIYGPDPDGLELAAACNDGQSGSLAFLSQSIKPNIVKKHALNSGSKVWALSSEPSELDADARPFDDVLVVSGVFEDLQQSLLLDLLHDIQEREVSDFEKNQRVVATGRLTTGLHVVVYTRDLRVYNQEFGLDQIFAIVDEDADATAEVFTATVSDTHICIVKTDDSLVLLKVDKSGDLDEVELPDSVPAENVLSACLYDDQHDFFGTRRFSNKTTSTKPLVLTVLTKDGILSMHPVSNPSIQIFQYAGLQFLPTHLSPDFPVPKHWRNQETLAEMSLCNLGSSMDNKPYLILRNSSSDITIYEPYSVPDVAGAYRFVKTTHHNADPRIAYNEKGEDIRPAKPQPMFSVLHDIGGMSVLFVVGTYPMLVCKPPAGMPVVHKLETGPILHVSGFHDSSCNQGFVYVNSFHELSFCELPTEITLNYAGWVIKKIEFGGNVSNLTYHPRSGSYVIAASSPAPYHLPRDDEWHPEWTEEEEKASPGFLPVTQAYTLKLISSSTHSVISQYHFASDEQVLSVKCLNLEVSEQTHERKDLIVVGTGTMKGENVVTRGYLYLFDIIDVVPQPEIPETDLKLKLVAREDVRGAVTAISSVGSQGFMLAAQGQKCMVRGLREDNAILPVAFLDMRYYVSVAKELAGTGLTILADAFSGLWLVGYSEEPYKMQLLGRDLENPSVVAAEFMPQDKQIYIITSDGNGELRTLQYDPWNPKTERGSILLHRSTFNTGYFPTLMMLLPRSPTPCEALVAASAQNADDADSDNGMQTDPVSLPTTHQILVTTREGAIGLITPLSEATYRRLSTLQTVLTTQLDQPCGLNPRAHRQVETDGVGGRAMIDGQVVKRWLVQSSQHKHGLADRVGGTVWDLRADIEAIGGAGLGYL